MLKLIFALSLINIVLCNNPLINLKDGCTIETTEGTIDLSPLGESGVVPRFKDQAGPGMLYTYSFNPCTGFSEGTCNDVTICQTLISTGQNFKLGFPNMVQYQQVPGHSGALVYTAVDQLNQLRTSTITLTCQPNIEGQLIIRGENPQLHYSFELVSKYACPMPVPTTPQPYPTATSVTGRPPHPQPVPGLFSVKTSVILLFSIQFTLVIIIILLLIAVIGQISRRNSADSTSEKSQYSL
ncbi:hypothetical protein LOTGIDRAFT_169978 [Lottia gigantea]|uniref:MRH domain-containing protein n=1 Tax=Lottia gigantea TaxID=225164 RepID=V3ZJG2_LOTGI|nr:hypothetical protein LOTGIDRAFT_169978 [Lottia gigantea]ESO82505.1 hypothetical protein LOTGIDRAFT_169978 [Lottia gigantea]